MELPRAPLSPRLKKKPALKKFLIFSQKGYFLYFGKRNFLYFLKRAFLIFPEMELSILKNKKFQEENFPSSKNKKITLKKCLIFREMKLSSSENLNKTFLYS